MEKKTNAIDRSFEAIHSASILKALVLLKTAPAAMDEGSQAYLQEIAALQPVERLRLGNCLGLLLQMEAYRMDLADIGKVLLAGISKEHMTPESYRSRSKFLMEYPTTTMLDHIVPELNTVRCICNVEERIQSSTSPEVEISRGMPRGTITQFMSYGDKLADHYFKAVWGSTSSEKELHMRAEWLANAPLLQPWVSGELYALVKLTLPEIRALPPRVLKKNLNAPELLQELGTEVELS